MQRLVVIILLLVYLPKQTGIWNYTVSLLRHALAVSFRDIFIGTCMVHELRLFHTLRSECVAAFESRNMS